MTDSSHPIPPTADFKELLDRLIAIASVGRVIANGGSLLRASRKALEDYVARLKAENVAARRTGEYWKGEHIAGNKVIDELRAELASLRDSQK